MNDEDTISFKSQKALKWWKEQTAEHQHYLALKHKPYWTHAMVSMSTSTIRNIYIKEVNQ